MYECCHIQPTLMSQSEFRSDHRQLDASDRANRFVWHWKAGRSPNSTRYRLLGHTNRHQSTCPEPRRRLYQRSRLKQSEYMASLCYTNHISRNRTLRSGSLRPHWVKLLTSYPIHLLSVCRSNRSCFLIAHLLCRLPGCQRALVKNWHVTV